MAEKSTIRVTVFGVTDVGRVREHNEDNFLAADLTSGTRIDSGGSLDFELGDQGLLMAVADGMGGAASGELASQMAVDGLSAWFGGKGITQGRASKEEIVAGLEGSLREANGEIYEKSQAESEHRGMGTTMTAVFALGSEITIGQVGDSRAYVLRKGKLVQITKDQSLISQLIEDGTLTEEEADRLGGRNIILQALGVESDVSVDSKVMEILDGDLLVICSDGLTGMVRDSDIERILKLDDSLDVTGNRLVAMANDGGGRDNITVILARFTGEGLRPPLTPLEVSETEGAPAPATFAAPEMPPAKKDLKKPILGAAGVVVLALIIVLLVTGGGETIKFVFPAPGGWAKLEPEGGGDLIDVKPPEGKASVEVSGVEAGKYLLSAHVPGYDPLEKEPVEITRGTTHFPVPVVAYGVLRIVPSMPGLRVLIVREADDFTSRWDLTVEFPSRAERILKRVPAGKLEINISRDGFIPKDVTIVLKPQKAPMEFKTPELDPRTGTLEIDFTGGGEVSLAGAVVIIRDQYGDLVLGEDLKIPESGMLRREIRVGTHNIEVRHPKLRSRPPVPITITEGQVTRLTEEDLQITLKAGDLRVVGAKGAYELMKGDSRVRLIVVPDEGKVEEKGIPSGDYLLRPRAGGPGKKVTILPGQTVEVRVP